MTHHNLTLDPEPFASASNERLSPHHHFSMSAAALPLHIASYPSTEVNYAPAVALANTNRKTLFCSAYLSKVTDLNMFKGLSTSTCFRVVLPLGAILSNVWKKSTLGCVVTLLLVR